MTQPGFELTSVELAPLCGTLIQDALLTELPRPRQQSLLVDRTHPVLVRSVMHKSLFDCFRWRSRRGKRIEWTTLSTPKTCCASSLLPTPPRSSTSSATRPTPGPIGMKSSCFVWELQMAPLVPDDSLLRYTSQE